MIEIPQSKKEREEEGRQVALIGQKLQLLSGDRSNEEHQSGGFHRLALRALGHTEIMRILQATNDAFQRSLADPGNKPLDPDRYFGGTIMKIVKRAHITLTDYKISSLDGPKEQS